MANRPHHRSRPLDQLRLAIDCLPLSTRQAMLDGVRSAERIIGGAYVDGHGGVCPMLAAHRRGAPTNFLSFARAWDRFTRAGRKARRASRRELSTLVRQLEDSLMSDAHLDLLRAIEEHSQLIERRDSLAAADPSGEILARRLPKSAGRGPGLKRSRPCHPVG